MKKKQYLGCKKTLTNLFNNIHEDELLDAFEKHDLCIDAFTLELSFIKFEKEALEKHLGPHLLPNCKLYEMVNRDYETAKRTLAENKPSFCITL